MCNKSPEVCVNRFNVVAQQFIAIICIILYIYTIVGVESVLLVQTQAS